MGNKGSIITHYRPPQLGDDEACSVMKVPRAVDESCAQVRVQAHPEGAGEAQVAVRDEQNSDGTKSRAAVQAVLVLKVGTSHTRPVRTSVRTCKRSSSRRRWAARGSRA